MRKGDKGLKIQYKIDEKILSLRFNTIEEFFEKDFSQSDNPMAATNNTRLFDVRWNKQRIDNCVGYKISKVKELLENFNHNGLIRKEVYPIDFVYEKIKDVLFEKDKRKAKVDFDGDLIKGNSQRYQTFLQKVVNVQYAE